MVGAGVAEVDQSVAYAGFFRETQGLHTEVAERAKEMLGIVASAPAFEEVASAPAFERVESGSASGTDREEAGEGAETLREVSREAQRKPLGSGETLPGP